MIIPEPEIWPVMDARNDLDDSLRVLDYAQYGLEIRELLEVVGPYTLKARERQDLWRLRIDDLGMFLNATEAKRRYDEQKEALLRNARGQFLVYAYSAFDFLVANMLVFLYIEAGNSGGSPPRPSAPGFVWDEEARKRFLGDERVAEIEKDKWMMENGKSAVVEERIKLLEASGFPIRSASTKSEDGKVLDWSFFRALQRLRHNVAHTSGRSAVHSDPGRDHKVITEADIRDLEAYMRHLLATISHAVYELPILARRA